MQHGHGVAVAWKTTAVEGARPWLPWQQGWVPWPQGASGDAKIEERDGCERGSPATAEGEIGHRAGREAAVASAWIVAKKKGKRIGSKLRRKTPTKG